MDRKAKVVRGREFNVLAILAEHHYAMQLDKARKAIRAEMADTSPKTVQTIVDRLRDQGLIEQQLALTPLGREVWQNSVNLQYAFLQETSPGKKRMPVSKRQKVHRAQIQNPSVVCPELVKPIPPKVS